MLQPIFETLDADEIRYVNEISVIAQYLSAQYPNLFKFVCELET